MTIDRFMGGLGIVLGLPGFLLLFLNGYQTEGVLSLLIGGILVAAVIVDTYLSKLPPYTIKQANVTLAFNGDSRKTAILSKAYKIRANFGHLTSITHKNIAADGSIVNLKWDGELIPASHIRRVLGEYEVTIDFPGPHRRFAEFSGMLSYEATDSFTESREGLYYAVDFPTKSVTIQIDLPSGSPCRSSQAFRVTGAGRSEIDQPTVSKNGTHLELMIKRPRVGTEYQIYWNW